MSINRLYHNWFKQILQLRPGERITRVRNLVWLMIGIYLSKSVHMNKAAMKVPGEAKLLSTTQRFSRLMHNPTMRVRSWYQPVARGWLQGMADTTREIRLIIDGTKIGSRHQLLIVCLAFRKRAIPIAWTWRRCVKGHSSVHVQLALLSYVQKLIPENVPVLLVGDTEFEAGEVQKQVEAWNWRYVLRQKPNNQVKLADTDIWERFANLVNRSGQSFWATNALLTLRYAHPVNLLAYWKPKEDEPWLLATNLPSQYLTVQAYSRRMWIEEMFGDFKSNGFDLEHTRLHHFLRLSRITLAVALLYVWLMSTGVKSIKNGERSIVDRKDRRDLSVFQIGLRRIERCLTNALDVQVSIFPNHMVKTVW